MPFTFWFFLAISIIPTIPSNKSSKTSDFSPNEGYLRQLFAESADVFFESYIFRTAQLINVTITALKD